MAGAGDEAHRTEVVDARQEGAGSVGHPGHAGAGDQPVERAAARPLQVGERRGPARLGPEIGDDVRVVEVDADDPVALVGQARPQGGADARRRPRDRDGSRVSSHGAESTTPGRAGWTDGGPTTRVGVRTWPCATIAATVAATR